MRFIQEIRDCKELLLNLTMRELKGKYKRTMLGQLWSLANPLAQMLIYTAVFAFVMRVKPDPGNPSGIDNFALWLMAGLLPWTFFTNVVNGSMAALTANENLIKKVYFPRVALIYATVAANIYSWAIEMTVLIVALFIFGSRPLLLLPVLLITMALLAIFATGVGMALAVANVYFRDVQHFVSILFQVWFYATPIVYPARLVAEQVGRHGWQWQAFSLYDVYLLNPLSRFVMAFRSVLYDNTLPSWETIVYVCGWSALALAFGYTVFRRVENRLAEAL